MSRVEITSPDKIAQPSLPEPVINQTAQKDLSIAIPTQSPAEIIAGDRVDNTNNGTSIGGVDIWSRAFREACAKRASKDRLDLSNKTSIGDIFAQLETEAERHNESTFQKGLQRLGPFLEGFSFLLDIATPFASVELAAASSIAVAKTVTKVRNVFSMLSC